MKKLIAIATLLTLTAAIAFSQETPMWVRKNAISPDGTKIAFSYKGDIFVVSANGGEARQITTNAAYDGEPMWTKDSKQIVFSSYREKTKDIYVISANGGTPKRITSFPGTEAPLAVLSDGTVLFAAKIQQDAKYGDFPGQNQLYATDLNGARPWLVTSLTISNISVAKDGTVLYEDWKGYEDALRKHHTSSVTRDIWKYEGGSDSKALRIDSKGKFTRLTEYNMEDRNPVFAADGNTFYFLSEKDGKTSNIYKSSLSDPKKTTQLTFETKNPVRFLSIADNGTLAYSYNGELYTLKEGSQPKKVAMTVHTDEMENEYTNLTISSGANSFAVSPDGKEVAFVARGDVYVTSVDYSTTKRITNTASQERNVSFSKDGRELYYSAERDGFWGIYKASIVSKDEKNFTYATKISEELFSDKGQTCFQPKVSPDGKWVAFFRDRTDICIKPTKGGDTKCLIKQVVYSYQDGDHDFEWSPDSQYILSDFQQEGRWNNQDICLIEIETGKVTDLTLSGYSDGGFRWALGGKAMTWTSDKNGYRSHGSWGAEDDIYIMFFDAKQMIKFGRDKEADEIEKMLLADDKKAQKEEKKAEKDSLAGKVQKVELDLANRFDRIKRLTRNSGSLGDYYLTEDGTKLFYTVSLESGRDLCVLDIKEGSVRVLRKGMSGSMLPSSDGKYIYITNGRGLTRMSTSGGYDTKDISFSGEFEYKSKEERMYMFEHCWKEVKEKFYVKDLHGVDWDYYHDNYRQFIPYLNNNLDFADLLSEMLGELNGSHTGARYYAPAGPAMSYLGAIYDTDYRGDGLLIKEVLVGGPLSLLDEEVEPGDIIESIDGNPIVAGENWYKLLTGKSGKIVSLSIKKGGKKATDVYLRPISSESTLYYKRWVKQREDMVEKLSGGRIGYVHVEGMDSPSFREVFSKALGKYLNCEALIVDTRHNGGGWLHDDLVTFLGGKHYFDYIPRDQYIGQEPFNKWTKPSCVLIGEDNYSDASGFPYAYKQLGLGKLIGAPIPGTMTAVWWENQVNSEVLFGIPEVGNWSIHDNWFIENHQIEPDIFVVNDPASVLEGQDKQLEAAVAEMLRTIDNK